MPAPEPKPGPASLAGRAIGRSFGASLAILLLNIGTGVLLARTLGPHDRGILAAALLWPTITAAVGTLGLMESSTYHVARGEAPLSAIVGSGLGLGLAQALLATVLGAALIPIALSAHHQALVSALLYLGFIPLNIMSLFGAGVLNGLRRYNEFQLVRLLVIVASGALLALLAALDAVTVRHAVLAYLAANALTFVMTGWLVHRQAPSPHFERPLARSLFRYGIRSHSSTVSSQLNERLDQLVISIFLAPRSLGIYVIAVTLTQASYLVGTSVAWIALPQIAPLQPGPERTTLIRRTVQLTFGCSALISLPVVVLAGPLIRAFFGSAFAGATSSARILAVAVVFLSTNRSLEAVLRALGRPLDAGAAELIALGATFGGLAILLPTVGLVGAAWASLLAYLVSMSWMCRRLSRALELPVSALIAVDREDLSWGWNLARSAAGRVGDRSGRGSQR